MERRTDRSLSVGGNKKLAPFFSTNYNNDDTHLKGFQFDW